jgi:NAD(P)-dependent dehydrogenase (short-subunit alcohol dehydrogenase family)
VPCDVRDRAQVEAAVARAVEHLSRLDVVIANAGVAAQLRIDGGDPEIFERTIEVNLVGTYYTLRAAAPHISHPRGYALAIPSLAAALHPPMLGAYAASKAGVEALADSLRADLAGSGARVGVAYFGELDTDMTSRGFGTAAAGALNIGPSRVAPLRLGVKAIAACDATLAAGDGADVRRAAASAAVPGGHPWSLAATPVPTPAPPHRVDPPDVHLIYHR